MSSRAEAIIEEVFRYHYRDGDRAVPFVREDLSRAADRLGVGQPKNLGEPIYQFRYVRPMPESVASMAPSGFEWVIRGRGHAKYAFEAVEQAWFVPDDSVPDVAIPSATPRLIEEHALDDEQALLSRVRHADLVSVVTGVVARHLQSHVRSSVESGQVELDDLYVGVDDTGQHFVIPIEAKAGSGSISLIQVEQGAEFCRVKKPEAVCIPLGVQQLTEGRIHFFVFNRIYPWLTDEVRLRLEREVRVRLT